MKKTLFAIVCVAIASACGGKTGNRGYWNHGSADGDARDDSAISDAMDAERSDVATSSDGNAETPPVTPAGAAGSASEDSDDDVISAGATSEPDEGTGGATVVPHKGAAGATDADEDDDEVSAAGATDVPSGAAGAHETGTGGNIGTGGDQVTGGSSEEVDYPLVKLVLSLASDTPKTHIVTSGQEELFAKYELRNPGKRDTYVHLTGIGSWTDEDGPGGIQDFSEMRITDCGDGWERRASACSNTRICHFSSKPTGPNTLFFDDSGRVENKLHVPPGTTVPVCLYGKMAEVEPTVVADETEAHPKSGDAPNLRIMEMITNDCDIVDMRDPYNPPPMILRKAVPTITWEPISEPLHDGMNTLARISVSSSEQSRPIGLQQLWFYVGSNVPDILTSDAVETSLTFRHPEIGEEVVWAWDNEGNPEEVGGHANDRGVFMWEEFVPHKEYIARIMFYGDEIATPVFEGLVGPITIEIRANVKGVLPGMSVTIELKVAGDCAGIRPRSITKSLSLFDANGLLADRPEASWPYDSAGIWWSDLSEGTGHRPMDWSAGVAATPIPSSPDYINECLVPGANGSSVVSS